ncbi:ECM4 [Mytilus edulis]|uniref:ECM4 n=1 Tax=Mytilus edulis TaxID=6550 RepID=A0A8S3RCR5_MYTED|nr:ECM4 [Mytilus edulis]
MTLNDHTEFEIELCYILKIMAAKENASWKSSINDTGEYVRKQSKFRNFITADGSSGFPAEANRYHLYVSLACPWAHRALIVRKLKGLDNIISCTVVDWLLTEKGWSFTDKKPQCTKDTINGKTYLREVYEIVDPNYDAIVSVPVLWDKVQGVVVNNESSEIIRMLNSEFNKLCPTEEQKSLDLYPEELRSKIDELNNWIYSEINNGVYKSGFATKQDAYNTAVTALFKALDRVVQQKRIVDYPNMWGYVKDIYQTAGISETVDPQHIMCHYQQSHTSINPYGIVSIGPDIDFNEPHGRK